MNKHPIYNTIIQNDFDSFKKYIEDGYQIERLLYAVSAKHNRIEFISYLLQQEPEEKAWDELTPVCAAEYGHLECLTFCIENGCPWDQVTPAFAAGNGHMECLKYTSEKIGYCAVVKSAINKQMEAFMYCFRSYKDKHAFWDIPFNLLPGGEPFETMPKRRYSL